jgi:hypothetical protein
MDNVVEPRRLVCPYCGNDIEVELTYTSMAYSEHRDLTGFECENWECNARWDNCGNVERLPKQQESEDQPHHR